MAVLSFNACIKLAIAVIPREPLPSHLRRTRCDRNPFAFASLPRTVRRRHVCLGSNEWPKWNDRSSNQRRGANAGEQAAVRLGGVEEVCAWCQQKRSQKGPKKIKNPFMTSWSAIEKWSKRCVFGRSLKTPQENIRRKRNLRCATAQGDTFSAPGEESSFVADVSIISTR